MKIEILRDSQSVAQKAAAIIVDAAWEAVTARGMFVMAVSGGHTPWLMLRALADAGLPWPAIHIVQVDERVAPAGDADRNLTHIIESLLDHAPLQTQQISAMPVELPDLQTAAANYANALREVAGVGARPGASRSGSGRSHGLARAGRPGPGSRERGCRAERAVSGLAANDVNLPDSKSCPACPVGRHGDREGRDVESIA